MKKENILGVIFLILNFCLVAIAQEEIRIQGKPADLKGIKVISIRCEVDKMSQHFHFDDYEKNGYVSTDSLESELAKILRQYGIKVEPNSPTILTVDFTTPGGTLMTYVSFIVSEKTVLMRDSSKKDITIWMATGYERSQIYPQPFKNLVLTFIKNWGEAEGISMDMPFEKHPEYIIVKLLPEKKFEFNGIIYTHDEMLEILEVVQDVQHMIIKILSSWETRSDASQVFKKLKDAGFNAKIEFNF